MVAATAAAAVDAPTVAMRVGQAAAAEAAEAKEGTAVRDWAAVGEAARADQA